MIEKMTIDGRAATVIYLTANMAPVEKADYAELVKVTFDDDMSSIWLTPDDANPPPEAYTDDPDFDALLVAAEADTSDLDDDD
jgi:hypothetical protein